MNDELQCKYEALIFFIFIFYYRHILHVFFVNFNDGIDGANTVQRKSFALRLGELIDKESRTTSRRSFEGGHRENARTARASPAGVSSHSMVKKRTLLCFFFFFCLFYCWSSIFFF